MMHGRANPVSPKLQACSNNIVQALLAGDSDKAARFFDAAAAVSRAVKNKAFVHGLIHRCTHAKRPQAVWWCVCKMVSSGIRPNIVTFNSVMDACAKVGDLKLALHWWREMVALGLRPNAITYNTIINVCAQARDMEAAETWILRMIEDGFAPCKIAFTSVIDACAKNGSLLKAESWYERMQAMGVAADAFLFNTLLKACAVAKDAARAEYWFEHMQAQKSQPCEKSYNILISAWASCGAADRAEIWLKRTIDSGHTVDPISYASVIIASARSGDASRARNWLVAMVRSGVQPNLACINKVLQACAKARKPEMAVEWFWKMVELGISPSIISYNNIIKAFARTGNLHGVEEWLKRMTQDGFHPDRTTAMHLVNANIEKWGTDAALRLLSLIAKAHRQEDAECWEDSSKTGPARDDLFPSSHGVDGPLEQWNLDSSIDSRSEWHSDMWTQASSERNHFTRPRTEMAPSAPTPTSFELNSAYVDEIDELGPWLDDTCAGSPTMDARSSCTMDARSSWCVQDQTPPALPVPCVAENFELDQRARYQSPGFAEDCSAARSSLFALHDERAFSNGCDTALDLELQLQDELRSLVFILGVQVGVMLSF